jgi:iron complex outermembrane receptor protein
MIDNRIPREPLPGFGGRADLGYATGNRERSGAVLVEGGTDRFALHVDAFDRRSGDTRVPIALPCDKGGLASRAQAVQLARTARRRRGRRHAVLRPRLPGRVGQQQPQRLRLGGRGRGAAAHAVRARRRRRRMLRGLGPRVESLKFRPHTRTSTPSSTPACRHHVPQPRQRPAAGGAPCTDRRVKAWSACRWTGRPLLGRGRRGVRAAERHAPAGAVPVRGTGHRLGQAELRGAARGGSTSATPAVPRWRASPPAAAASGRTSLSLGSLVNLTPRGSSRAAWPRIAARTQGLRAVRQRPARRDRRLRGGRRGAGQGAGDQRRPGRAVEGRPRPLQGQRVPDPLSNYLGLLATGNTRDAAGNGAVGGVTDCGDGTSAESGCSARCCPSSPTAACGALPGAGGRRVDPRLLQSTSTLDLELRGDLVRADNLTLGQPLPRIAPVRLGATLAWATGPWSARLRRWTLRAPGPRAGRVTWPWPATR